MDATSSYEGLRVIWELYRAEEEGRLAGLRGFGLGTFEAPGFAPSEGAPELVLPGLCCCSQLMGQCDQF